MNNTVIKTKVKIFIVIGLSFLLSNIMSNTVFLAGTPLINQGFIGKIARSPSVVAYRVKQLFAAPLAFISGSDPSVFTGAPPAEPLAADTKSSFFTGSVQPKLMEFSNLPVSALNQLAPGVYAASDYQSRTTYVKITEEAQWEERTVEYDGKQIKVRFLKGLR